MRPLGWLTLLLLAAALAPADAAAQEGVRQARAADPNGAVRIINPAGRVIVRGWDRDSIVVAGAVPADGRPFFLHVQGSSAKLGVDADEREASPAELEVHVPAGSRVWVSTSTAAVIVQDVRGGVDVSTLSGRIELRGSPAEAYLESLGGAIVAEVDTRRLQARTAAGDIEVRGRVADAQVYTVSGVVSVLNKQVERGRFESVDGGIRYRGGLARGSSLEFVTHGGAIEAAFPASSDAEIRISSHQGSVHNALGRMSVIERRLGTEGQLTLGRGGAEVIIRTFKGSVTLRKL